MQIGVALDFHGRAGDAPRWPALRDQARAAEAVGFDLVVVPDHLFYPAEDDPVGAWESVAMTGALAAATDSVRIGHSVFNPPYRPPALLAKIAVTLDEVSGGRYICGIGAGNTTDAEYAAFGLEADPRYSRAAEAIEIVHHLLKRGRSDVRGRYHAAPGAEIVPRGPRAEGPPIVVAAHGRRMMGLAARFADEWNGFDHEQTDDPFAPYQRMVTMLEEACASAERDPSTLRRSLDIVVRTGGDGTGAFAGPVERIAEQVLRLGALGVEEVRCYLAPGSTVERIESSASLVDAVHRG